MNPYWFNRQELLQKAKDKYHNSDVKGKAAEHYVANKDVLKEKANSKYKNLSEEEKEAKFDNIEINIKEFHKSKQQTDLNLVYIDKIVIPDKFKGNDDGSKNFIGYKADDIIKPLCIILPQMSGYLKYFENGGKNVFYWLNIMKVRTKSKRCWVKNFIVNLFMMKNTCRITVNIYYFWSYFTLLISH